METRSKWSVVKNVLTVSKVASEKKCDSNEEDDTDEESISLERGDTSAEEFEEVNKQSSINDSTAFAFF